MLPSECWEKFLTNIISRDAELNRYLHLLAAINREITAAFCLKVDVNFTNWLGFANSRIRGMVGFRTTNFGSHDAIAAPSAVVQFSPELMQLRPRRRSGQNPQLSISAVGGIPVCQDGCLRQLRELDLHRRRSSVKSVCLTWCQSAIS
jgi:hypothetical protein